MADETVAVNDNTNVPQPSEPAEQQQDVAKPEAPETMLGGKGSTEQQVTGAPEAYDFKPSIPDGVEMDETITKEFSDIARGMNLTNEQANQMAAYGIKYAQQAVEAARNEYSERVAKWGESAKSDMGVNFNVIMSTAGAGIEAAEKQIPGIRQALNETGAGNRIEIIKLCEMLGKLVQADPGKLVNVTGTAVPREEQTWYPNSNMK